MFDSISSALGTSGGGGGLLGALASVDPGPAIGKTLAGLDKTVNSAIPGGWITVGGLAAGGLAIAYAPEIMALASESGLAPSVVAEQVGVPGVVAEGTAAGTPVGTGFGTMSATPSTGAFGTLNASIPAGAVVGTGEAGSTIGGTYLANGAGGLALDATGNAIPYSSVGLNGVAQATGGMTASDALTNANRLKSLAKLISPSGGKPTAQQFSQFQAANQPVKEQFGGLYNMNQHPYLSNQQTASLSPDSYNVSGQNIASPTAPTNQLLANLLYPKA